MTIICYLGLPRLVSTRTPGLEFLAGREGVQGSRPRGRNLWEGEALEIPAGTVGCGPLGASLPGICAQLVAAERLSIPSVCPTAREREPAAVDLQFSGFCN